MPESAAGEVAGAAYPRHEYEGAKKRTVDVRQKR